MAYRIEIREAESTTDRIWHDVTDSIVSTGFKVRSGFASLGSNADLGKLSLTYRTYDLATASIFGSTVKRIRVIENDRIIFEGYSDSASSVDSTESQSLAWVKLTAYPYIKALENVELSDDWVAFDMTVKAVAESLWSKALEGCKEWIKEAIEESITITFPDIAEVIPLVKVSKGDKPLDTLISLLSEHCYTMLSLGDNVIRFIQPYSADPSVYAEVPFESMFSKPTIKTAPYIKTKAPQVTLSKTVVKEQVEVYTLTGEDGKNAEKEIYKDGTDKYSPYYPEDGDAEVSYSNPDIENDMVSFLWAKDLSLRVESRRSDNSADGDIVFTRSDLMGDKAYYRIKNTSTTISCYLNQLRIIAGTAYFSDRSYVVRAEGDGEKTEVETQWIQTSEDAILYAKALADESRCSTSSLVFKSDILEGMAPGMLLKVGNIPAIYIIKSIEKDLDKNETTFSCQIYNIKDIATDTFYRPPSTLRGPKGQDAPTLYYVWSMSPDELIVPSKAVWSIGEQWMLFGGNLMGDFGIHDWESSWEKLMESRTETYNYLWAKVGEDGEPFRLQGVSPMDFSFVVSPTSYIVNPRNLADTTMTIRLSRQNGIKGTSTLYLVSDYKGIALSESEEADTWSVTISQKTDTVLSFKVTASIGNVSKTLEVIGQMVGIDNQCIGWVSELPAYDKNGMKLLEGDTCLLDGFPKIYNGSSWDDISDINSLPYDMGVAIGNTALFSGNDVTKTMTVLWAFIQNLYSQSALIEHLRTHLIELSAGGIIKSEGYVQGGTKKGFVLNSDGTFECYDGTFKGTLDGAKGRFTGQLETITLKTVLGGESSYPVGSFTTASSLLSSLNTIQQNLGVDIRNKTFKAGGTLSGLGTIVSMSVSQIYSEYKEKSYSSKVYGSYYYKWESARISWITVTFTNSSGSNARYVIRKVYRKISYTATDSTPTYSAIPNAPATISELLNFDDYYYYENTYSSERVPSVDKKESAWDSVGLARNESLSVSNLTVYNNTQERMYIENLPTAAPSESNRIWRDSSGYLRIV